MENTRRRIGIILTVYLLLSGLPGTSIAQNQEARLAEAKRLNVQAVELLKRGRYREAIPLAERTLAICEAAFGPEDPNVARVMDNQAQMYQSVGNYARAEHLYRRSLVIRERAWGREHPEVASALNNLALLLQEIGDYKQALPLHERALIIQQRQLGPEHPEVATSLSNMGWLYHRQGNYGQAIPLFQQALRIDENAFGLGSPESAYELNNLAETYRVQGSYDLALPLYQRAVAIMEKVQHPELSGALNNLALLYSVLRDYEKALQLFQRALVIDEKNSAGESPAVASDLGNIAVVYMQQGDYELAMSFLKRSLAINKKAYGLESRAVAGDLHNIASAYLGQGDYSRALPLFRQALAINEKASGPEHPDVADMLNNLAGVYTEMRDYRQAIQLFQRAAEIRESNIIVVLDAGSQQQKQAYLDTLIGETFGIVSLHTQDLPQNAEAAQLAMTTILRRKGRTLDVFAGQLAALRQRAAPADRALLERLAAVRTQSTQLILHGQGASPEVEQLNAQAERLEDTISRSSAEFRAITQRVTLKDVAAALPTDAALVEWFLYYPLSGTGVKKKPGAARYVAYTLQQKNQVPQFADLGEAATIDAQVQRLREALIDPERTDVEAIARDMDERIMRPIRQLLGSTRQLFLSPDGPLNLIPFAALVDENGQYLVENYSLTYLTSGRDLLRLQGSTESRSVPMILADPLYDLPASQPDDQALPQSETNLPQDYSPLPGTAEEAMALGKLWPDAQVLIREKATEYALKQVDSPYILHIATHGFFLPDRSPILLTGNRLVREIVDTAPLSSSPFLPRREDPLLRSGLILAGIKQQQSGKGQDGVLTALEVAGLNLWGTNLVVLSACKTALGDVRYGEGIYGLRRALVLAGSRTQVMSLWKVSDTGTRDLMVAYYTRLQAGEERTEALRQVQLAMLHKELKSRQGATDYWHPYYWAAFISSGDWRSLDNKISGITDRQGSSLLVAILSIVGGLSIFSVLLVWRLTTKTIKPTTEE